MEDLTVLAVLALGFFFIAVPWAAFAALSRANNAQKLVRQQRVEIDALREELSAQRGQAAVATAAAAADVFQQDAGEPESALLPPFAEHPRPAAPDEEPLAIAPPWQHSELAAAAEPPEAEPATADDIAAFAMVDDTLSQEVTREGEEKLSETVSDPVIPASPESEVGRPPAPGRDFEEAIGSRWAVWVGGIALAFGALFLIRYSIEAGLFGPGVRLLMGAAFSVVVAGASEYLRRRERLWLPVSASGALARLGGANIPAVLAGVSVLGGFGVAFAAHAIYGFIGPGTAFALMGLIGLAALSASLLHGIGLGVFGLLGSYATPFLVSSTAPDFASLSLFVTFVTAAAFLLHARRPSTVVTLGAVAGHAAWTSLIALAEPGSPWPSFLIVIAAVLALGAIKEWPARRGAATHGGWRFRGFDITSLLGIAVPLILSGVIWVGHGGPGALHAAMLVTVLVAIVAAIRHADLAPLAPLAGAAAPGMILLWPSAEGAFGLSPDRLADILRLSFAPGAAPLLGWSAALLALICGAPPFLVLIRRQRAGAGGFVVRGCLAFASALAPVCLLTAAALRINGFERSPGFAVLAALLTVALFAASEVLLPVERGATRSRNPLALIGSAAYAAAGAIAIGLAVAFALRETWLVVGFSVAAAGVAMLAALRPIPLLRSMAAALGTAALARLFWSPIVTDVGSWPVLNWLIPAYALPALCFAVGALALSSKRDRPRLVHEALAAFFMAAFVLLEVRQFFAGPDLVPHADLIRQHYLAPRNRLFEEVACHVLALGLLAAGFHLLARSLGRPVFAIAAGISAAALIVVGIGGLGALLNPLLDGTAVPGWPIVNRLLWYVLVGGLLGLLGFALRSEGRSPIAEALSACAVVLVSLGAVLIVRHAFSGPVLAPMAPADVGFAEAVTITLVLLALAAATRLWQEVSEGRVARFALHGLAALAIGWAVLALGLARNPMIDMSGVAGPVVFNRILWGYGTAVIGFAGAAWWMREAAPDIALALRRTATAGAALAAFLLLRHGFHGPDLVSEEPVTLAEAGCYATLGFLAAIAVMIAGSVSLFGRSAPVRPEIAAAASCGMFALLSGFAANPLLSGVPLAGLTILDNALVGYLLPAALAFLAARWARAHLADALARRLFGAAAILGGLAYVLIEVRRSFVGPNLLAEAGSAAELYAYSAALLLYGVALLALGFRLRSKDLRLASLGVVTIAICKAFLVDMSGLEGLLRALSFIGLGASLVAIGLAYQRLLRREAIAAAAALPYTEPDEAAGPA